MVIAAQTNVAVAINFHCHVDADTLIVTENLRVVGVVSLDLISRI